MSYGVQSDGRFERKHIDEIQEDMLRRIEHDLGDVDFHQSSPIKQIVDLMSVELAQQWEAQEENYYVAFYEDTHGEALDKLLALAGMSRRQLQPATGEVQFTIAGDITANHYFAEGDVEVTTPATDDKPPIPFVNNEDFEITPADAGTVVTVSVIALDPVNADIDDIWLGDETNVAAHTITEITNPSPVLVAVDNEKRTGATAEGFRRGRDQETDAEFRLRYENEMATGGVSTLSGIESSIYNEDDDIISVRVDEIRDPDIGYGPNVTVYAPTIEDDRIAQAIYNSRAGGVESIGETAATALTDSGEERTEYFDRAEEVSIDVNVSVRTSDTYPHDGDMRIEDSITRYIGGQDSNEVDFPGLGIGEDVVYDQVFKRAMEVRGVISASIEMAQSGDEMSNEDIVVDRLEAPMAGEVSVDEQ